MNFGTVIPTRRWALRVGVILVAAYGTLVGITAYDDQRTRREWADACAEADRLDPGWRWDELLAALPAVPDGRNSAEYVASAARLTPAVANTTGLKIANVEVGIKKTPPCRRLSAQVTAAVQKLLADAAPALSEADRIADCPAGRITLPGSPVVQGNVPAGYDFLTVARSLLYPRLVLRVEQGDADAALDDVRLIVSVSRPLADCPTLLNNILAAAVRFHAVRGVERVLAQGEPSPAALDATRRLLEAEAGRPLLLAAFRGERACLEDTLRALDDGRLTRDEVAWSMLLADPRQWTHWPPADRWLNRLTGRDLRRAKAVALVRHHTRVIEWLKESPDGLTAHDAEWAALRAGMTGAAKVMADYLSRYVDDLRTHEAQFRCAVAALAAERFRRDTGRWPATLAELVPTYLTAVPSDPQNLEPLRLAHRSDGIVIYSVGPDGADDGGAIATDGAKKETDVGIRLWDVARRRQPAGDAAARP